jgi:hypothetical protein
VFLLNVNAFPNSTYKEEAMKKLLALAAVIGLGMSTIGCEPAAAPPPATPPAATTTDAPKDAPAAEAPKDAPPAEGEKK